MNYTYTVPLIKRIVDINGQNVNDLNEHYVLNTGKSFFTYILCTNFPQPAIFIKSNPI